MVGAQASCTGARRRAGLPDARQRQPGKGHGDLPENHEHGPGWAAASQGKKSLSAKELWEHVQKSKKLNNSYGGWFDASGNKITLSKDAPKKEMENAVFKAMGYDEKLTLCKRPEQLEKYQ
jgi:hypothetical protein